MIISKNDSLYTLIFIIYLLYFPIFIYGQPPINHENDFNLDMNVINSSNLGTSFGNILKSSLNFSILDVIEKLNDQIGNDSKIISISLKLIGNDLKYVSYVLNLTDNTYNKVIIDSSNTIEDYELVFVNEIITSLLTGNNFSPIPVFSDFTSQDFLTNSTPFGDSRKIIGFLSGWHDHPCVGYCKVLPAGLHEHDVGVEKD